MEKRRRQRINNNLQELKALLPHGGDASSTKADVVERAVQYMRYLHSTLSVQMSENKCLREDSFRLCQEIAKHRAEVHPLPRKELDADGASALVSPEPIPGPTSWLRIPAADLETSGLPAEPSPAAEGQAGRGDDGLQTPVAAAAAAAPV